MINDKRVRTVKKWKPIMNETQMNSNNERTISECS